MDRICAEANGMSLIILQTWTWNLPTLPYCALQVVERNKTESWLGRAITFIFWVTKRVTSLILH